MPVVSRILTTAALTGSLVLGGAWVGAQAAPSAYGSGSVITALPAKAVLLGNQTPAQSVTVTLPVPEGLACATDMTTRVVGQRNAVTVSPVDCSVAGSATWTVSASALPGKRHAVVKFVSTNPSDGARTVGTLGVKVNPGTRPAHPSGKPSAKPNRPVASASPSPSPSVTASPTSDEQ